MEQQELEGGLEVLEADLAETENSVYHLVRSNVEIAQVRPSTHDVPVLRQRSRESTPAAHTLPVEYNLTRASC